MLHSTRMCFSALPLPFMSRLSIFTHAFTIYHRGKGREGIRLSHSAESHGGFLTYVHFHTRTTDEVIWPTVLLLESTLCLKNLSVNKIIIAIFLRV